MSIKDGIKLIKELHENLSADAGSFSATICLISAFTFVTIIVLSLYKIIPYWVIVISSLELGICFGAVKHNINKKK